MPFDAIERVPLCGRDAPVVWRVALDRIDVQAHFGWLDSAERERAARFRFETDRRRYVASHVALRAVLGQALNIKAEQVMITTDARGKPCLDLAAHAPAVRSAAPSAVAAGRFNLSHSDGVALIAWAQHNEQGDPGIDLERLRRVEERDSLAREVCSAAEGARLEALPGGDRDAAFLRLWTVKEAVLKALGLGLSVDPRGVDTSVVPLERPEAGWPAQLTLTLGGHVQRLRLWSLALGEGLIGTLAALESRR